MQKLNLRVVLFSDNYFNLISTLRTNIKPGFYNIVHSSHFTSSPQSTNSILHDCTEIGL